jgi:glycosyltransferase involved in cell wall biosynthesis
VHFLGFRSDVPRLMRTVDIVALTSSVPEPFGRVVVEGMLARRPVIATGVGGVPEIVTDGTGVLVPPGDARALASALTRLLSDPVFAGEVACKGRLRATTHFTVEAMVDCKSSHIEAAIRKQVA